MKNISKSLIALFAVLAFSCNSDDVQDRPTIKGIDAPVLMAPEEGNTYTLVVANAENQAERFVWSKANFGENIAINYEVQLDVVGNTFAAPQSLGAVIGATQLSVSVETLNNAVIAAGGQPFTDGVYEVRVKASANDTFEPMYSNLATITVSPYSTRNPQLFVIGDFLENGGYGANWTNASTLPSIDSPGYGQANYEGYIYMNQPISEFKLLPQSSSFEGDYGANPGIEGGLLQEGEDNIKVIGAGYYRIQANTTTLTYNLTATEWGVIGNATPGGWDNSTPMTYDPATKKWSVIVVMTSQSAPDNGWKFRANNEWTINLGDTTVNSTDGTLREGGDNIGVSAGTYKIELDLSNPRAYTYTITLQ
ncbi:SusE domain-containing protein [Flavobacterium antarcticum]|uniref:SusE domain-containing protein n=1 Tax=Flavobacterium antarcticum TaxID=271155 RepID=UPI001469B689|nr:SusE domain-containing protein [Flavobacterium antarcticum]